MAEDNPVPDIPGVVRVASFCLGSKTFVTNNMYNRLFKWSLETGKVVSVYELPEGQTKMLEAESCFPGGSKIVTGTDNFTVTVWDESTGIVQILTGQDLSGDEDGEINPDVDGVAVSSDGKFIASGHGDKVDIWNWREGTLLRQIRTNWFGSPVAFINGGRELVKAVYAGDVKYTLGVWNVRTGKRTRAFAKKYPAENVIVVSTDGKTIASGDDGGGITIWDVKSGKIKAHFQAEDDRIDALALAPDKRSVLVGRNSGEIAWLDAATGNEIAKLVGHTKEVSAVNFSPDGKWILSGSWDGTFRLWNAASRKTVLIGEASGRGWASWTPELAFVTSPDEALAIFSSWDTPNMAFTDEKARPDLVKRALAE